MDNGSVATVRDRPNRMQLAREKVLGLRMGACHNGLSQTSPATVRFYIDRLALSLQFNSLGHPGEVSNVIGVGTLNVDQLKHQLFPLTKRGQAHLPTPRADPPLCDGNHNPL